MKPKYDLDKIKFATDTPTFQRAVKLYEQGKVKDFKDDYRGFSATVLGGNPYNISVSESHYDRGYCDCYLGQNDKLCKHMIAVAIYAVKQGNPLAEDDKIQNNEIGCSGKTGELTDQELSEINKSITEALKYIKSYNGPSRTWFAYQDSLTEGCNRLAPIISNLPISLQTAKILAKLALRLDKKLHNAVDDSDGTVGGCIQEIVYVLEEYAKIDPECIKAFSLLLNQSTIFGWEDPLIKILDESV